jgi:hypothetical protein
MTSRIAVTAVLALTLLTGSGVAAHASPDTGALIVARAALVTPPPPVAPGTTSGGGVIGLVDNFLAALFSLLFGTGTGTGTSTSTSTGTSTGTGTCGC